MAKIRYKHQLTYKSGYLIDVDDEVVALPPKVAEQLNGLDTLVQKARYLNGQPAASPEPSLDGFVRESEVRVPKLAAPFTPTIDGKEAESKKILKEIRSKMEVDAVNDVIDANKEAFIFMDSEEFIEGPEAVRLDLPELGSPLELTPEKVTSILKAVIK